MFGVYQISFPTRKRSKPDLSDWVVTGRHPIGQFEDKKDALNYAADRRFRDADHNSTSRLRQLGMWRTRIVVKSCLPNGRAKIPGMIDYIKENYTGDYQAELLAIWED